MKLFICSGKRAGKDHAAEYLQKSIGLKFKSSSLLAAEIFLFDLLKDKYGYKTIEECFNDRHAHRKEWFEEIAKYNSEDPTKLCAEIFELADCYVGLRSKIELAKSKERWKDCYVIWIDAEGRVEPEDSSSCTVTKDMADLIIENKTSVEDFDEKLRKLSILLNYYYVNTQINRFYSELYKQKV